MIFEKCSGPDMFSWLRHCVAEVCALPSALLVAKYINGDKVPNFFIWSLKSLVCARTCMAVRATKKNSNRVPETTTAQAVPSLSHAHTCVAVRAWPYVEKKFQTACQKQPSSGRHTDKYQIDAHHNSH